MDSPLIAIAFISLIFGLLAIPILQLIGEFYLGEKGGAILTLLFFFSPYVFVFSSVIYTEGVFILLTLTTWFSFLKGRTLLASFSGIAAGLTRPNGFLIAVPLILAIFYNKDRGSFRNIILCTSPILALPIWFVFCGLSSGDFLATFHTNEWTTMITFSSFLIDILPKTGFDALLLGLSPENWMFALVVWLFIVLLPLLLYKVYLKEKTLAFYTAFSYLGLLAFGAMLSFPRTMSFLFPMWIPITHSIVKNRFSSIIMLFYIGLSYVISLKLWTLFLNGYFIA